VGIALLGTTPATPNIPLRIYGSEILAGTGCGINYTALYLIIPRVVERRDLGEQADDNLKSLTGRNCHLY
jgi:hypothetical protein